jgi:predicted nucleotidyltransferase
MVDILITKDIKEFKIEKVSVGGRKISVVSLRDLLKMKIEAGRPQDLIDIQNIKEKLNEKK